MQRHSTYLFSGGGTGGHLFPGIAVAEELLRRNHSTRIVFAGSERSIEKRILDEHNFEHHALPTESLATLRHNPVKFFWRNRRAYQSAKRLLWEEKPETVIGLGGFTSVPVVLAASSLGIPVTLLEQNIVPGRATRWLSKRASRVCLSFQESTFAFHKSVHTCVTGNPVRADICALWNQQNESQNQKKSMLLVLGGSQGARAVNNAAVAAVLKLGKQLAGWKIVHQTGSEQCEFVRQQYARKNLDAEVQPFFPDLTNWYSRATIVISRAGATTLAELACSGTPAVLMPYPNSVGDHQLLNARAYESVGAVRIVEQQPDPASTADNLAKQLTELTHDPSRRHQMQQAMRTMAKPDAAVDVVNQLEKLKDRRQVA